MRKVLSFTLAGAALAVPLFAAIASPASATDEFPPNPAATISSTCSAWTAGEFTITYTNVGGLSDADFTTTLDGVAQPALVLAPDDTKKVASQLADGDVVDVVITAPSMNQIVTTVGPLKCYDATATLSVDCVNGNPVMTGVATNIGQTHITAILVVNGNVGQSSQATVVAGGTFTFTQPLPDNAPYTGSLTFQNGLGAPADIAGNAACTPPTTTTEAPTTTTEAPTTTTEAPTTTVAAEPPPVESPLPTPAPVALPVTGRTSGSIVWLGILFTVTGLGLVRLVRRPSSQG